MTPNFQICPRTSAPLQSLVWAPAVLCYKGGGHKAPLATASRGTLPVSSLRGSGAGFRTRLEGTVSHTIIHVIPELLLKLRNFRKHEETVKTTAARVASRVARGALCYRAGAQISGGRGIPGNPAGEFPKGFRGSFRTLLEGMLSRSCCN